MTQFPTSAPLIDEFRKYGVIEPRPYVIDLAACSGMEIMTIDGKIITDWAGFYGSKLLGHNHLIYADPAFQDRLLTAAMNKTANPDFVTQELIDYYRFLHVNAPRSMVGSSDLRVYTLNSGAEAIENALKFCVNRWYHRVPYSPGARPRFMSFRGGFHGRTVYALHVTDVPHNPIVTRNFHELLDEPIWESFPSQDMNSVAMSLDFIARDLKQHAHKLAGIIIEPMQGAGGHNVTLPIFFEALSELAHQYDVPLIFDEVQTGGGQCGAMWMIDTFDLPHPPTCVVSAKKLGCGVVYMNELIPDAGVLDSTWSGHLVDMIRVMHEYEFVKREELIKGVKPLSQAFENGLRELQSSHPVITNVRGTGLYQGFSVPSTQVRNDIIARALREESLLLLSAGADTIRFRPNICVTNSDINDLLMCLDRLF